MSSDNEFEKGPRDYPVPEDDKKRAKALSQFDLNKIEPEECFDRLTNLASDIFNVPMSIIVLLGRDKQYFKSCVGIDNQEAGRDVAFCNYTVYKKDVFCIENTHEDDRFFDNNFVQNSPHIRSYLGAPLITDRDYAIGTFCVVDTKPRSFTESDKENIEVLAEEAMSQIRMKKQVNELNVLNKKLEQTQQELSQKERRFQEMANNIQEVFWLWSADGKEVYYVNSALKDLFGIEPEELYREPWQWIESIHPDDKDQVLSTLKSAWRGEFELKFRLVSRKGNEPRWMHINGFPIHDENNRIVRVAGTVRDITNEQNALERLGNLAKTDSLTGLYNRYYFFERLKEELSQARRNDCELSLLLIDLNDFKRINDSFGHTTGDKVLNQIAERIQASLRETDVVARYGGDEFVVILPDTPAHQAKQVANKIVHNVGGNSLEVTSKSDLKINCSVGIAAYDGSANEGNINEKQFVNKADEAMFHAKKHSQKDIEMRKELHFSEEL